MATILKLVAAGATVLALGSPQAAADGLPVLGVDVGRTGVSDAAGDVRYVALAMSSGTTIAAIARDGGRVRFATWTRGPFTIPAVAMDGTAAGLSHDGSTLVLIRPRVGFPQARTRMLVLAAKDLRIRRRITLAGDYSFDAISPDGRTAYLIHYTSPRDFTAYEVRALDTRTARLDPAPILDPYEPDESMRGLPLSRVTSEDGRWAYTLYDGNGEEPFVHALDTVGRTARCIDLEPLAGRRDIYALKLRMSDGQLLVHSPETPLLRIDRGTFAVRAATVFAEALPVLAVLFADPREREDGLGRVST